MAKITKPTQEKMTSEELLSKLFHAKAFTSEVKTADDNARTLVVKISSINPDRSNDIVDPAGADITNFLKNPVVLLSHNYQSLPIAKCIDIQIGKKDITAKVLFPDAGVYDVADTVYQMCKEGFMNAWSIGFIPSEFVERKDDAGWGYTFTKWQLLEFSAVSVPDNQDALTIMRSKGIDVDVFSHEQTVEAGEAAVKTLDEEEKTEVVVEETPVVEAPVEEEKTVETVETKEVEVVEKSGRVISKKNESLLKTAVEALTEVLKALEAGEEEEATTEIPVEEEAKEVVEEVVVEKAVEEVQTPELTSDFLKSLTASLKHTDKEVGLSLRLLKVLQVSQHDVKSDGERI